MLEKGGVILLNLSIRLLTIFGSLTASVSSSICDLLSKHSLHLLQIPDGNRRNSYENDNGNNNDNDSNNDADDVDYDKNDNDDEDDDEHNDFQWNLTLTWSPPFPWSKKWLQMVGK